MSSRFRLPTAAPPHTTAPPCFVPSFRKGRALTERIERLAKETGEAAELHQQEETAARKKKAKVEVELAAVVSKYDRDMAAKTAQIEEIKVRHSTNLLLFDLCRSPGDVRVVVPF